MPWLAGVLLYVSHTAHWNRQQGSVPAWQRAGSLPASWQGSAAYCPRTIGTALYGLLHGLFHNSSGNGLDY